MPNFQLSENELKTRLEKWLYFIKNLEDFQSIPTIFNDEVFEKAFERAELAKFGPAEMESYEMNLKNYRDYKNTVDTAFDEGKIEGKLEEQFEIAKRLKSLGVQIQIISKSTGLSEKQIEGI